MKNLTAIASALALIGLLSGPAQASLGSDQTLINNPGQDIHQIVARGGSGSNRKNDGLDDAPDTDEDGDNHMRSNDNRLQLAKRSCPSGYEDTGPNGSCVLEPPEPDDDEDEPGHGGHGGDDGPNHT